MLIIKKLLKKTYQNTKIKITINKKYRAENVKMHHRIKKETSKKITKIMKFQKDGKFSNHSKIAKHMKNLSQLLK